MTKAALETARKLHNEGAWCLPCAADEYNRRKGECSVVEEIAAAMDAYVAYAADAEIARAEAAEAQRQAEFPCGCISHADVIAYWIEPICESHRTGVARITAAEERVLGLEAVVNDIRQCGVLSSAKQYRAAVEAVLDAKAAAGPSEGGKE